MTTRTLDVIVVGLGAAGSATLYHLARSGAHVLGLDRYAPPHMHGSTHSESRIIRKAYFEGTQYLPLLARAYELWGELEERSATRLVNLIGCLNIGAPDSILVRGAAASAAAIGTRYEVLKAHDVEARFPGYCLPEGHHAVLDFEAGYINPERCVAAHLQMAQAHGAEIRLDSPVRSWQLNGSGVSVSTNSDSFAAQGVVLTAGAWMRDFAPVPIKIERVTTSWFAPVDSGYDPSECPVFIFQEQDDVDSYGFPDLGNGVKVGLHHKGPLHTHPDEVSRTVTADDEADVRRVVKRLLPRAAGACLSTTVCLYSNTPDKDYIIDYLPGTGRRVVIGSACSGHGFKASAAVGEQLAALAVGRTPSIDLAPFAWRWPLEGSIAA